MGRLHHATTDLMVALEDHLELLHAHILECRACRTFFQSTTRKTLCKTGGDLFAEVLVDYSRIRFVSSPDKDKRAAARMMNGIRRRHNRPAACELDNPPTLF